MKPKLSRPWLAAVNQLCTYLEHHETVLTQLQQIDQEMVLCQDDIAEFTEKAVEAFAKLSRSRVHLYADTGRKFTLFSSSERGRVPEVVPASAFDFVDVKERSAVVATEQNATRLREWFHGCSTALVVPVWTPDGKRFGVVVIDPRTEAQAFQFQKDDGIHEIEAAALQLGNGIGFAIARRRSLWAEDLTRELFEMALDPEPCFGLLAQRLRGFFIGNGPFALRQPPEIEVLIFRDPGNYLSIVGSTGQEAGAKVKVESSVVGLLFEAGAPDVVIGNPQVDEVLKLRYKSYLGSDASPILTELAVPVIDADGRRMAALNIESVLPEAFEPVHVAMVRDMATFIGPVVTALRRMVIEWETRQEAQLAAQQPYWLSMGRVLSHNTNGGLAAVRIGLDNARTRHGNDPEWDLVIDGVKDVERQITQFAAELHRYSVTQQLAIRSLINDSISLYKMKPDGGHLPQEPRRIVSVHCEPGEDFQINCSALIKMHLFNLIDNSSFWVTKRMIDDARHDGRVVITVARGPVPDAGKERDLNRTCEVRIWDNGPGCPKDILATLLRAPVTSRRAPQGGMGFALFAAATYVESLGGAMRVSSVEGEFFEVTLHLPVYYGRIHSARTAANRVAMES